MGVRVDVSDLAVSVATADGTVDVLRGVSASIGAGELVALVGPSGSGKTTLLNVVGGLEPAFRGRVLLDGEPVWSRSPAERARVRNDSIGFVFQDANLIHGLTAGENVMIPLLLRSDVPAAARRGRAAELLDAMGLAHKADTRVERLSGGERQRVATARSLVGKPGLVLVDEPTGNLDDENARRITDMLLAYCAADGATLMIATHDSRVITRAARQLTLEDGRIAHAS